MDRTIFSEQTLKLRTKLVLLSSVSLFIGITEVIPHNFTVIGLKLSEHDKTLGWFIFIATFIMLVYFFMNSILELQEYNFEEIVQKKTKNIKGEFGGATIEDYYWKSENQIEYEEAQRKETWDDIDSINEQSRLIKNHSIKSIINMKKWISFIFEFALPILLAFTSLYYLDKFLF